MMFTSYDYEFYFIKFYQIYEQHVKFPSGVANCSSLNDTEKFNIQHGSHVSDQIELLVDTRKQSPYIRPAQSFTYIYEVLIFLRP
jgi:hypothetical protein